MHNFNPTARTLRVHRSAPVTRIAAALAGLFVGLLAGESHILAQTEIAYTLPRAGKVSLAIYDSQGRQLRTLLAGESQAVGKHTLHWDGLGRLGRAMRELLSGHAVYRISVIKISEI